MPAPDSASLPRRRQEPLPTGAVGCVQAVTGTRRSPAVHDRRLGNSEQFWGKRRPRKERTSFQGFGDSRISARTGVDLGPERAYSSDPCLRGGSGGGGGAMPWALSAKPRGGPAAGVRALGLVAPGRRQQQEEA